MTYLNEFGLPKNAELCRVQCPNEFCRNVFFVQSSQTHRGFTCVKCGSEWHCERLETTKDIEDSL